MVSLVEKCKRHFAFTKKEVIGLLVVSVFTGFFYSFRNWGVNGTVSISTGLSTLLIAAAIAGISYFLHLAVQRIFALSLGYKSTFELNMVNLLISLMIVIMTNGYIAPIFPGWHNYSMIRRYRMGKWPPLYNTVPLGWVTSAGVLVNVILALVGSIFFSITPTLFWEKVVFINLGFAVFTLIPIPFNDGLHVIYGGIPHLLFISVLVGIATLLILAQVPILVTIFLSLGMAVGATTWYFLHK